MCTIMFYHNNQYLRSISNLFFTWQHFILRLYGLFLFISIWFIEFWDWVNLLVLIFIVMIPLFILGMIIKNFDLMLDRPYVLFLRSFKGDGTIDKGEITLKDIPYIYEGNYPDWDNMRSEFEEKILKHHYSYIRDAMKCFPENPFIGLTSEKDVSLPRNYKKLRLIRIKDENWKKAYKILSENAAAIVLFPGNSPSFVEEFMDLKKRKASNCFIFVRPKLPHSVMRKIINNSSIRNDMIIHKDLGAIKIKGDLEKLGFKTFYSNQMKIGLINFDNLQSTKWLNVNSHYSNWRNSSSNKPFSSDYSENNLMSSLSPFCLEDTLPLQEVVTKIEDLNLK